MTDLQIKPTPPTGVKCDVALLGIGTANPPVVSQSEAITLAEEFSCESDGQRAWLRRVFSRSGVNARGSVLQDGADGIRKFYGPPVGENLRGPATAVRMARYEREAPALLERAATIAMEKAGVSPGQITHVVTVSCTGFSAPGLDVEAIMRLGLSPAVRRMHIGFMGCHAAFNALAAAQDAVGADRRAIVLVCCVELSTLHFAYGWHPEKLVANALFADGAAACIVGAAGDASAGGWKLAHAASMLLPESRDAMSWRIGDHGFEMTLSSELPALIAAHARPWCERWLADCELAIADIDRWAIHPGGPRILGAVQKALGLAATELAASAEILSRHGNMSSATVLFVLDQIARQRTAGGEWCVAIGFGPGLMMEGMLLRR
jgi:prepilin-type processing-associated H-X9-DG protein